MPRYLVPEQGHWLGHRDIPGCNGAQPLSRVASGVTETRRVVVAPSPRVGSRVWWPIMDLRTLSDEVGHGF